MKKWTCKPVLFQEGIHLRRYAKGAKRFTAKSKMFLKLLFVWICVGMFVHAFKHVLVYVLCTHGYITHG